MPVPVTPAMVEPAGIEPASEHSQPTCSTCVAQITRWTAEGAACTCPPPPDCNLDGRYCRNLATAQPGDYSGSSLLDALRGHRLSTAVRPREEVQQLPQLKMPARFTSVAGKDGTHSSISYARRNQGGPFWADYTYRLSQNNRKLQVSYPRGLIIPTRKWCAGGGSNPYPPG